ncbi:hypothetical protein [Vibrio casei]|uniref:hypothetical protein n=1 Tax=Vibrio casei TaxID=673372 RepID=UPI003F9547FE
MNKDDLHEALKSVKSNSILNVAEYFFDNSKSYKTNFDCSNYTGIPYDDIKRIMSTLERKYALEFERVRTGRRVAYMLVGFNCDTSKFKKRKSKAFKEKFKPKQNPLIEKVFC